MKPDVARFLRKLLLFLAPLLLLAGYAEIRLRRVPNGYTAKRAFLERQLDSVEVLVLGSSHAYNGVDPDCLSRPAFNLAYVSQSLYYDTRLVRKYLDRMPRLRLVLVETNYFSLWYQLAHSTESWRDWYYYHFWGIRHRDPAGLDLRRFSYIALYTWKVTLQYARHNFNSNPVRDAPSSGFALHPADTLTHLENIGDSWGQARAAYHDALIKTSQLPGNVADLDTLLEELGRRHIDVVLVTLPVHDSYARHLNPAVDRRNAQILDSLCARRNCRRADYQSDPRFLTTDFNNADHLNYNGARKFSTILDHDLIATPPPRHLSISPFHFPLSENR
jgi:hypothetical protein